MVRYVSGGKASYGQLAGILMLDSGIPRIPGDPGHAETFPFPVRYGVIRDFPFQDLVDIKRDNLSLIINAARELERNGASFIAADCGLFSPFQREIANALNVPFIGSSLSLIPFISGFLPDSKKIGVITGHGGFLKDEHLEAAGARRDRLLIEGMEGVPEFRKVVIERGNELDVEEMRRGVLAVAKRFAEKPVGPVVLECTNLITFRSDIQRLLGVPVYDAVTLIEFFAEGYRLRDFSSRYIPG